MKNEELKKALRQINAVLIDPRFGSDGRDQLQKAKRELEAVARSGKLDRDRIFRTVGIVSTVLLTVVEASAIPKSE